MLLDDAEEEEEEEENERPKMEAVVTVAVRDVLGRMTERMMGVVRCMDVRTRVGSIRVEAMATTMRVMKVMKVIR